MRVKVILQYDGTAYHGWQLQPNKSLPTVQATVEQALSTLYHREIKVQASGRTDRGVHAEGQVISFDTSEEVPVARIVPALKGILPEDIGAIRAEQVDGNFHPRYWAKKKWYRYIIYHSPVPNVFWRNYSYHVSYELDYSKMEAASSLLLGSHSFKAFSTTRTGVKTFNRELEECSLTKKENLLYVDLVANGFLYNMARIIVGTLLEVGRGYMAVNEIEKIIESQDRKKAGPTAPPQGLYLKKVIY
ncbi:MAG: tRNA pseudouridine(38-40) synthase TruA [Bacillota bacterium]|nr:tRNA pseudouridine(38-40) synthase TruA [Bacillota bacterium]